MCFIRYLQNETVHHRFLEVGGVRYNARLGSPRMCLPVKDMADIQFDLTSFPGIFDVNLSRCASEHVLGRTRTNNRIIKMTTL